MHARRPEDEIVRDSSATLSTGRPSGAADSAAPTGVVSGAAKLAAPERRSPRFGQVGTTVGVSD